MDSFPVSDLEYFLTQCFLLLHIVWGCILFRLPVPRRQPKIQLSISVPQPPALNGRENLGKKINGKGGYPPIAEGKSNGKN